MNQLNTSLTWGLISLQGILLLIDPEARNHIYKAFSAFNSVSNPFLQSFSENLRCIVSLILIPTFLYPQSWIVPKFASLIAYVFFVCLHSNPIFYAQPGDIKLLLIQLLILGKALMLLVDDMVQTERAQRIAASSRKIVRLPSTGPQEKHIQPKSQDQKKIQQSQKVASEGKQKGKEGKVKKQ